VKAVLDSEDDDAGFDDDDSSDDLPLPGHYGASAMATKSISIDSNGGVSVEGASVGMKMMSARQSDYSARYAKAKLQGYEGDPCPECGALTLLRNGSCLKCDSCGATTGCS